MPRQNDILQITNEILDIFKKYELTNIQSIFALKAVELSINEEATKALIKSEKDSTPLAGLPGVS